MDWLKFMVTISLFYSLLNGAGSSELESIECLFIDNLCQWQDNQHSWVISNYSEFQFGQPDQHIGPGNFIIPSDGTSSNEFMITSKPLDKDFEPFCFTFHYYMFGNKVGSLSLDQLTQDSTGTTTLTNLWVKHGSQRDGWIHEQHYIQPQENCSTSLSFTATGGHIALAQFTVKPGLCPKTSFCDFEDFQSCWWTIHSDSETNYKWTLFNRSSPEEKNSHATHGSNVWLNNFLGTPNLPEINTRARTRLISEVKFPANSKQCLTMSVYKPDDHRDRIQIALKPNNLSLSSPIWSSQSIESSNQDPWIPVQVDLIEFPDEYQLVLIGENNPKSSADSTIAIDNLLVDPNPCPSKGSCDFNRDLCGYKLDQTPFLHGIGRVENPSIFGPSFDPSRNHDPDNLFLYIDTSHTDQPLNFKATSQVLPRHESSCLSFEYFFAAAGNLTGDELVQISVHPSTSDAHPIWTLGRGEMKKYSMKWSHHEVSTASDEPFKLEISAYGQNIFFAVDDIKYSLGLCPTDHLFQPPPGNLYMHDDFEAPTKDWLIDSANQWIYKEPAKRLSPYPELDASQNPLGGFIYSANNKATVPQKSLLSSRIIQGFGKYCISLSYWCTSGSLARLKISLLDVKNNREYLLKSKKCSVYREWKSMKVTFTANYPFQLQLIGNILRSHLAVDEIYIYTGSCLSVPINSVSCDFETDSDCPVEILPSVHNNWKIGKSSLLSVAIKDHSTDTESGGVIALDFPMEPGTRDQSIFVLARLNLEGTFCLKFAYMLNNDCQISVWTATELDELPEPKVIITSNSPNVWYIKRFQIELTDEIQIIFGGTFNENSLGIAALDDISLIPGKCQSELACDFESECFWSSSPQETKISIDNPKFELSVGSQWEVMEPLGESITNSLPSYDNTLGEPQKGHFITTNNIDGAAILSSPPINYKNGTEALCLSFAYSLPHIKTYSSSMIEVLIKYSSGFSSSIRQISPTNSSSNSIWKKADLTVKIDSSLGNSFFLYIVGRNRGPKAIDDISVDFGPCSNSLEFYCDQELKIPRYQVCDHKYDCPNKLDEATCGNCSFTNDLCGYSDDQGSKWQVDQHSGAYVWSSLGTLEASLRSPIIQKSSASCKVKFEFIRASSVRVKVKLLIDHQNDVEIWDSSAYANSNLWSPATAYIERINHSFRIAFWARRSATILSKIFQLRNVEFINCGASSDSAPDDSSLVFCTSGQKLLAEKICDGSFDCEDGDDEINCGYTIFTFEEGNFQGWRFNSEENGTSWRIVSGGGEINGKPSRDHTTGLSRGYYALLSETRLSGPMSTPMTAYFDGPELHSAVNCSITFYYNLPNPIFSLEIVSKDARNVYTHAVVKNITNHNFKKAKVELDSTLIEPPFVLSFKGIQNPETLETQKYQNFGKYLAIDDIIFSPECYGKPLNPSGNPCSSEQFHCLEGDECISADKVCDSTYDCLDGADESNCTKLDELSPGLDCNFNKNNLCGWTTADGEFYPWELKKHLDLKSTMIPVEDHSGEKEGFLYAAKPQDEKDSKKANLLSRTLPGSKYCVSFWYFLFGEETGQFDLRILSSKYGPEGHIVWKRRRNAGRRWLQAEVEIREKESFQMAFQADVLNTEHVTALDDIVVRKGACQGITCDFENDFCSWQADSFGNATWELKNGAALSGADGPITDHSTQVEDGGFAYINSKNGAGTYALLSPQFLDTNYRCLEWWFTSNHNNKAHLSVYQVDKAGRKRIWRRKTNLLGSWRKAQVTLKPMDEYQIGFEAKFSDPKTGYFAIDDLLLKDGRCSAENFCDFERDICGWSLDETEIGNGWIRYTGRDLLDFKRISGPHRDVTTNQQSGYYLFAYFTSDTHNETTGMISPDMHFHSIPTIEMKFWVYFINHRQIELYLTDHNSSSRLSFTPDTIFGSNYSDQTWTEISVQISSDDISMDDSQFFDLRARIINTLTDNEEAGVALDSIEFSPTDGSSDTPTTPSNSQVTSTTIKPSKEIAFFCDIESDECPWKNKERTTSLALDRIREVHRPENAPDYPANDHTTFSPDGFFLYSGSNHRVENSSFEILASLDVDTLTGINDGCISFWYFLSGSAECTLSLNQDIGDQQQRLWSRSGSYSHSWNHGQVNIIGQPKMFKLSFQALPSLCGVGLDDISYSVGSCQASDLCDFEVDNCGFDNVPTITGKDPWIRTNGKQIDLPPIDHTYGTESGNFLWVNKTVMMLEKIRDAKIMSPIMINWVGCIEFAYFMEGSSEILQLQLEDLSTGSTKILWSTDYPSEGWEIIRFPVDTDELTQFRFNFIYQLSQRTQITANVAIDDVRMNTECQSLGYCDFEEDFCAWRVISSFLNTFDRASGKINQFSPSYDATFKTDTGYYAYAMSSPVKPGSVALKSVHFPPDQQYCFSFSYFKNGLSPIPVINLAIETYDSLGLPLVKMMKVEDKTEHIGQWSSHQVQLDAFSKPFRILLNTSFMESETPGFIAIDDLQMFPGNCSELEDIFDERTISCGSEASQTQILRSQICDFIRDCPDNWDQNDCGACDFEESLCGWFGDRSESWRVTLSQVSVSMPDIETTLKIGGQGSYIDLSGPRRKRLISPILRHSSEDCFIYANLYINSSTTVDFKMFIENINLEEITLIYSIVQGLGTKWLRATIYLGRIPHDFRIWIDASSSKDGIIALDDIEFDPKCASHRKEDKMECGWDEFFCTRMKRCIPVLAKCDYRDDCGDGEDEEDETAQCNLIPGRCDFEDGFCDWKASDLEDGGRGKFWDRGRSQNSDFDRPTRDHTKNSPAGYYAMTSWIGSPENPLISPALFKSSQDGSPCQMTFYYQYSETNLVEKILLGQMEGKTSLQVLIDAPSLDHHSKNIMTIQPQYYIESPNFKRLQVNLDEYIFQPERTFRVKIVASNKTSSTDSGAWFIDDISFSSGCKAVNCYKRCSNNGSCVPLGGICDFRKDCPGGDDELGCTSIKCDFEDHETCGWELYEAALYYPIAAENVDPLYPETDASGRNTGGLVVLDNRESLEAYIKTSSIGQTNSQCSLQFKYYCDLDACNLGVYIQTDLEDQIRLDPIWKLNPDQFKDREAKWRTVKVYVGAHQHLKFTIMSDNTYNLGYVVGLDEVEFLSCEQPLPSPSGSCLPDQFQCRNGNCIDEKQRYDFSDDCLDGSDEVILGPEPPGRCDFESPCSFWIFEGLSPHKFELTENVRTVYQPERDHTTNSRQGNYVSFLSTTSSKSQARIESPLIDLEASSECHLMFWTNIIGEKPFFELRVFLVSSQSAHDFESLLQIQAKTFSDFWEKYTIDLSEYQGQFKILIEGLVSRGQEGSINLDDISLSEGCVVYPNATHLDPGLTTEATLEFECEQGYKACRTVDKCYPQSRECDFRLDCSDETDEMSCPSVCTFEEDWCSWQNDGQSAWTRENTEKISYDGIYGPKTDHTWNTNEGYFMIAKKNPDSDGGSSSAELLSPRFTSSGSRCTLKFYYYLSSASTIGGIRVYHVHQDKPNVRKIWSISGDQGPKWNLAHVNVGQMNRTFQIKIEAFFSESTGQENIAIDDILFEDCAPLVKDPMEECAKSEWECDPEKCIPLYQICDGVTECSDSSDERKCPTALGNCDFDDSEWEKTCNWTRNMRGSTGRWDFSDAPIEGIQSAGYLTLRPANYFEDSQASIIGPLFQPSSYQCHMTIQYYMANYLSNALLELAILKNHSRELVQLTSFNGLHEKGWIPAHWVFESDEPFQVVLNGIGSTMSPLMIDSIRFSPNCAKGGEFSLHLFPGHSEPWIHSSTFDPFTKAPITEVPYSITPVKESETTTRVTIPRKKENLRQAGRSFPTRYFSALLLFGLLLCFAAAFYLKKVRRNPGRRSSNLVDATNPIYDIDLATFEPDSPDDSQPSDEPNEPDRLNQHRPPLARPREGFNTDLIYETIPEDEELVDDSQKKRLVETR